MRFVNHSMYDNWTVSVEGQNISTIIDKMIRLAAKNTEYFASDIVFDISDLNEAVKNRRPMERYLGFRDGGVVGLNNAGEAFNCCNDTIQWWRLTHEPNNGHDAQTILIRVDLIR